MGNQEAVQRDGDGSAEQDPGNAGAVLGHRGGGGGVHSSILSYFVSRGGGGGCVRSESASYMIGAKRKADDGGTDSATKRNCLI